MRLSPLWYWQVSALALPACSQGITVRIYVLPSGVGKTELAKALAALLFDDEKVGMEWGVLLGLVCVLPLCVMRGVPYCRRTRSSRCGSCYLHCTCCGCTYVP